MSRAAWLFALAATLTACNKDKATDTKVEEAPKEEAPKGPNAACDALLTAAQIESVCGAPATLKPSEKEDGAATFCDRSGEGGVRLVVRKHESPEAAKTSAQLAAEGRNISVGAIDSFSIEILSRPQGEDPICGQEDLEALMDGVRARVRAL